MINQYIHQIKEVLNAKKVDYIKLAELLRQLGNHLANNNINKLSGKSTQAIGSIIGRAGIVMNSLAVMHAALDLLPEAERIRLSEMVTNAATEAPASVQKDLLSEQA